MKALLAGLSLMGVISVSGAAMASHDERGHQKSAVHAVPELDPTTAGAALALMIGGVAIAHGRRRRAA
jgi:hypothetical protein